MWKTVQLLAFSVLVGAVTGCATQQQQLATRQPTAIDTALRRGRFDLNCPAATAVVLSSDFIQPAVQGPWVSGLTRMETQSGFRAAISAGPTSSCVRREPKPASRPAPWVALR
jgi:hypothetical protein